MVMIVKERDSNLTDFGKTVLQDRYLFQGESYQDLFARVAKAYAKDDAHAQRLYDYMSNLWFMPATPILANGGTTRGLPISCFLNETDDSLTSIASLWLENVYLAASGGGIGSFIGNIRSINEEISNKGHTSGVIPFIKVTDSMTLAISQGSLRRGSAAVYMHDTHPEIEEFIDIRRPTGGDVNRRCLNINHAVCLSDAFMHAVHNGKPWHLKSPHTGKVTNTINARDLWIKILSARVETGEPYILFIDNVNKHLPDVYNANNFKVKTSNLCSEITLLTGKDHLQKERTAVCCLSSLNVELYEQWKDDPIFIEDVMYFLDNVLEDFIQRAPDQMQRAKYSAMRERSVGLGVMGFHSFLQSKNTPIESVAAKSWNKVIFSNIQTQVNNASRKIAEEKGACPDAIDANIMERFSNKIAIAPTASISIICGGTSAGIEPFVANCYTHKTLSGTFIVRNKYLKKLLQAKACDNEATWSSISMNEGSVQHLDCLTPEEKEVFKTGMDINQMWLIDHAADRQKYICQSQSLNIFVPSDIQKKTLHEIHFQAWKKGIKSLYYCRSSSIQRAEKTPLKADTSQVEMYDECLSCQ